MNQGSELARLRRAQIVNLSISEIMLLLVFMAIAFSFLAKNEGQIEIPRIQAELNDALAKDAKLEAQLSAANRDRAELLIRVKQLNAEIADLTGGVDTITPGLNGRLPTYKQLVARIATLQALAEELQKENAQLRLLVGGKAPGLPKCLVTSGFMFSFVLLQDGRITGNRAWDAGADMTAQGLPGVPQLSAGLAMNDDEFRNAASLLASWAHSLPQPCRFSVTTTRKTTDAALYDHQLSLVDQYFYYRRLQ